MSKKQTKISPLKHYEGTPAGQHPHPHGNPNSQYQPGNLDPDDPDAFMNLGLNATLGGLVTSQQDVFSAEQQANQTRGQFDAFGFENFMGSLQNPYADIQTEFDNLGAGYQNVTQGMTSVMDETYYDYEPIRGKPGDPGGRLVQKTRPKYENVYAGAKNVFAGARNTFAGMENAFAGLENQFAGMENQFSGLENQFEGMENRYEDMTVDMRAADFAAQQTQQQQANIMQGLRGAAGSSGIAGLAQAMANQGQLAAQQQAANIGQQERQNQMLAAQEATRIDMAQRGEASRLATQEAQAGMAIQQAERAGAAQLQAQTAQAAMANQMAERQGEMQAQQMRMQGAAQQQAMILGGAQTLQSQQIAAAQQLQNQQIASEMQLQQMDFRGALQAEQNAISQANLIAQGAWAADMAAAQGAMDVQAMEFGQLSTQLGMDYAELAGAREAFQMGQQNLLSYAGLEQGVNMQRAANKGPSLIEEGIKWYMMSKISDRRLKKNISKIGKSHSGLNIYSFEYKDSKYGKGLFQGVMSDEIPQEAVIQMDNGYDAVDYSKLDVEFKQI
tara:strand:- start:9480 stop:11153 length:1674 start_codon:yes stop_codon:yes gene_type:complete